ncbi:amidohydrolase family protein [Rariglobus hedericola]|uniref:Amidohydrolase family protein n=1 Tax=Rariglobus hedericola TaxID=2597822 RepID=A0A556QND9_9BACT|nr:amidohydrolase family protein [Rariglobus hedericola]TSJ78154.1 amidohydrolase family protein [Rariglobus hedericola]
MAVIDAHVHLYPPEVNRDPAGWAAAHGESHWAVMCARVRKSTGKPVQGFPSVDDLLEEMDVAGVEGAVLLGWYWETHDSCVRQNRFYEECVRAHPDRFSAFATVHAGAGVAALDEVRRARDNGLIGLGELSPHSQGVSVDDPCWLAVLTLAGDLELPVNLHVTDPLIGKYPGRVETPLVDFYQLAAQFPQVKFILAHWGGRLWREGGLLPENVWVDTAATPLLYDASIWAEGLGACRAERILWGTDYPLELYPKEPGKQTFPGLLDEAQARMPVDVLGANAARLLSLG